LAAGCGVVVVAALASACGGSSPSGFAVPDGSVAADGGGGGTMDAPDFATDGSPVDVITPDVAPPEPVTVVYGHSPSVLYKLDPKTKAVTTVGSFDCSSSVIDLAIDENNKAFVTSFGAIYSLDLNTAKCKQISAGSYPNSLSFVPKGTLDPNAEALVGYFGSTYVRIDTTTGQVSNVGALSGGYSSSGDIVSVKNGGTFLTVKGPSCADCLVQVDPKTGNLVQNYGSLGYTDVFGIAFWGGKVYGFTNGGELFEVSAQGNQIMTTIVPIPNKPPNLQFWGAGSSTSVPATGDGGTIPVK
jgi:hypothetical protein